MCRKSSGVSGNMADNCCYKCARRSPHCHGDCEDYKKFAEEREVVREALHRESETRRNMYEHVLRNVDLSRKKRRNGK